jgi:hypothetical protein
MSRHLLYLALLLSVAFASVQSAWAQGLMSSSETSEPSVVVMAGNGTPCHEMHESAVPEPAEMPVHHCQDQPCQCDHLGCHASASVPVEVRFLVLMMPTPETLAMPSSYLSILSPPAKRPPIFLS